MSKLSIFLFSLIILNQSFAIDKSLCEIDQDNIIKRITPSKKPNYFFKTSPDGRYIYYIAGNKNYRIDTKTGEELLVPGNADPVPSSDGQIMTSINWKDVRFKSWSLNLQPMNDWDIERDDSKNPIFDNLLNDSNTRRTYQSVGTLGNNSYRVLSYDDGRKKLVIRDYKKVGNKISSIQSKDIQIDLKNYRLPMISKDGSEFVALDIETNETVIFSISKDGKKVQEVDRLIYPTGKGDFSLDKSKLTFHVTEHIKPPSWGHSREVKMPPNFKDEFEVRNVFVYDRNSKSVTPITQNKKGNSYFPVFLENGNVVYLDQSDGEELSFVYSKIPSTPPRSIEIARSCFEGESFDSGLDKLAQKWMNICTDWQGGNKGASKMMMLNISYDLCLQLANDSKDKKELVKVCDALKNSENQAPKVQTNVDPVKKMIQVKCAICHQGNIPFDNPSKLKSYKNKILDRITHKDPSKRMPAGGSLSKEEINQFKDYLETL
jgi:mono/diheme cytochrome c family protein